MIHKSNVAKIFIISCLNAKWKETSIIVPHQVSFLNLRHDHVIILLLLHRFKSYSIKKMKAFSNTAPCSMVEVDRRFRGAYYLHRRPNDGAVRTIETSVNFYKTTRRSIPEGCHLYTYGRENLKFHLINTGTLHFTLSVRACYALRYVISCLSYTTWPLIYLEKNNA
jgi:hypothetical protein